MGNSDYSTSSIQYCTIQYNATTNQFEPLTPPLLALGLETHGGFVRGNGPFQPITQQQMDARLASVGTVTTNQIMQALAARQQIFMDVANKLLRQASSSKTTSTSNSIDLNNFLSDQNPIHIVSWRER